MLKLISVRELTDEEKQAVKDELREFLKIQRDVEIQRIRLERKKIAETIIDQTERKKFLKEPIQVKKQRLRIKFIVENEQGQNNK
ncbi:MAG: hypothetical protein KGZ42_07660 [Melioribacter sp.]|nr:hypothetical protein [Melioribacter sp.]